MASATTLASAASAGSASEPASGPPVAAPWWRDRALLPSAVSGVALIVGYGFEWGGAPAAAVLFHAIALLAGASTFVPDTLRRLARGRLGVGLLMTIAAIGAVLLGHVGEAAALAFLFSLAETLEGRAMSRAKDGLRALLALLPETAIVVRAGGTATVPASEVRRGDVLQLGAGDRVATDGIVREGRSNVDTSAVTGESIPVQLEPGDAIAAGTITISGALRVEATADGRDNSLTQIVELVRQAHAKKGNRARLADGIARPLVPTVLVLALLIVAFGFLVGDPALWTERALVVLVAASPCALAIAVPVTVISAIGSASKLGVVITSGAAFEQFGTIRTIAFDKTGTLTMNDPRVVEVVPGAAWTGQGVVDLAAALEAVSGHPLASAITAAGEAPLTATDVEELAGLGIAGQVDGAAVRVGNTRWLPPLGVEVAAETLAGNGMTVVVVEVDGSIAGLIGVRDELRPDAADAIDQLSRLGIRSLMLTGDNTQTAQALASQAGIAEVHAEQLPADKARVIERLASKTPTAMVGDGINDAPALATATVGIAMGTHGAAAAIESADIAFTGSDLRLLPSAFAHARRGRRIMTVNIALALAIIVVLFPLALFGVLGLAGVVLVHEAAELLVILNGVRAARRR
ncbi:heavy metal translocating P-type ATPase [Pseudoclavibacter sp. RFBJ3]|nr:heavy metal translocating P-type ATPase [Pseudoclavibacter sp. RFBJ5]PPF92340.1 heavy metal translocating P-type ATPase [Pseudoclavibacter sp. RFBJ3]PPF97203.1 heavy metal translocating P-type ATPase [Pseudoclavibacter sp. RFBH5]PPG23889.1 heavy metal translocating P-type ATPase [Pseudoclavibacter sp. RFBI4]